MNSNQNRYDKNDIQFKEKIRTGISVRFQIIFILLGMSAFIFLVWWRSSLFSARENPSQILPITPTIYKEFGGFSKPVQMGLYINQFIDFSMITNEFIFDGVVWFTFDPGVVSVETLEKFSFLKGEIISKSPPSMKLMGDKLNVQYQVRVKFSSALNYTDFPLDDHQIYIVLINQFVSPSEIYFESNRRQFVVAANVSTTGWELHDRSVQVGYFKSQLDPDDKEQQILYPGVIFLLDYGRNSIRYALSIILPLALISYLILLSVSLRLITAISITAAGVTTILAYRFVIENLSPKTGFFMLSDYLFFLFLAATIAVFIVHVAETRYQLTPFMKKLFVLSMHITIVLVVLLLFFAGG